MEAASASARNRLHAAVSEQQVERPAQAEVGEKYPDGKQASAAELTMSRELAQRLDHSRSENLQPEQIDRDLAMHIQACDFRSSHDGEGGTIRNVMTVGQAFQADLIGAKAKIDSEIDIDEPVLDAPEQIPDPEQSLSGDDLCTLISGRDYLTLLVREGDTTRSILIKNDAFDKSRPGALLVLQGDQFVPLELDQLKSNITADTRIVLHGQVQSPTWVSLHRASNPLIAEYPPHYHERQKQLTRYEQKHMRQNTCPVNSINNALGGPVLTQQAFDRHVISTRSAENLAKSIIPPDDPLQAQYPFYLNQQGGRHGEIEQGAHANEVCDALNATLGDENSGLSGKAWGGGCGFDGLLALDDIQALETWPDVNKVIIGAGNHYVAFVKTADTWTMIDSLHEKQETLSPSEYIDQFEDLDMQIVSMILIKTVPRERNVMAVEGGVPDIALITEDADLELRLARLQEGLQDDEV